jgi:hypothetical protein
MNANTGSANTGISSLVPKNIVGLVFLVLFLVAIYYLYQYLYGKNPTQGSISLLSGTPSMSKTTTDSTSGKTIVSASEISGVLDGGEYSASFWIYVSDTKGFSASSGTKLAHLLEISNTRFVGSSTATKGNTMLFVGLNPINGSLVVRQSTSDPAESIKNSMGASDAVTGTMYPLDSLITNYNSGTTYTSDDRCDITNGIEYQRWVLVTVVGNGRTLDVYIDGKLARSCVYKAGFALGSPTGKAQAYFGMDNGGNLKGYFSNGMFYNYALTPDAVWALYQQGPGGTFSLWDFFKNLFSVNVSFSTSAGLNA